MKDRIEGVVTAPASKSSTLRALICCAFAGIETRHLQQMSFCDDALHMCDILEKVGFQLRKKKNGKYEWQTYDELEINGSFIKDNYMFFCGESGFIARAMVSLGTIFSPEFELKGSDTLLDRNLGIIEFAKALGLEASSDKLPCKISGQITKEVVKIPEQTTSQLISGLLLTLPLLKHNTTVKLSKIVSKPYIDLTLRYLRFSGIKYDLADDYSQIEIAGGQEYKVERIVPESDWSSISFIIALGMMNGEILVDNIEDYKELPDRNIVKICQRAGADVRFMDDYGLFVRKGEFNGFEIDLNDNPDMAPVMVALASQAKTKSLLKNVSRITNKESNRLEAIKNMCDILSISYIHDNDDLIIHPSKIKGGIVKSYHDHRIAMAALILNSVSDEKIEVDNYQCINKSYPNFLRDLKKLNVKF